MFTSPIEGFFVFFLRKHSTATMCSHIDTFDRKSDSSIHGVFNRWLSITVVEINLGVVMEEEEVWVVNVIFYFYSADETK